MTRFEQLSMYSSNSFNLQVKKVISLFTMFAVLLFTGSPLVALAAAPTYSINIVSKTVSGLTLNLSGVASSTKFAGNIGSYAVTVTDWGDGSPMTLAASNFIVSGDDFSATWNASHTYTTSGTRTVVVKFHHSTVSGNEGSGDSTDTEVVVIPPPNTPPTADAKTLTVNEDINGNVTLTGTDPESNPLTFAIVTNPTNGTVSLTGSTATYTPNLNFNGTDSFTYRVNDGVNNSVPATVSITVNPINDTPVLTGMPSSVNILEMTGFAFILNATDVDGDSLTYSATGIPDGANFDSETKTFTWTPSENQGPGSYNFTVSVNDGTATTTSNVSINVVEVNTSPVLNVIGNKTAFENAELTFSISGSDSDFPTQGLIYSAAGLPDGAVFSPETMTFSWTPTFEQSGNHSVTFTVSDGSLSDSETISISVGNTNRAPDFSPIANQTVNEETEITVTPSATDPDGDTLTYSVEGLPDGATFDSATGKITWTPDETQDGTYEITISVTDGSTPVSQEFTITVVEVNKAPTADNKDLTTDEDTSGSVTLTGTDPDDSNQTLVFTLVDIPDNGTVSLTGSTATYTPNANFNGSDSFTYTVDDGEFVSATATVSITVNPVNDGPTIDLNGDETITIGEDTEFSDPGATCSDIDSEINSAASISGEVNTNEPGTYTITYTCSDGGQSPASIVRTVTVSAAPVNNKPIIVLNGNASITLNTGDSYTEAGAVANDIEDGNGIVVTNITGTVNTATVGTYTVTYNFTDTGLLAADPVVRTVTVNQAPVVTPPSGGGGAVPISFLGGATIPAGRVLGESTTCGIYLSKFLRKGYKNDAEQVKKVQQFLNNYETAGLPVTGTFGNMTDAAVKKFQKKYADEILIPWGLKSATGIVYQTTTTKINKIMCPELNLGTPTLIPIDQNPEAPKL